MSELSISNYGVQTAVVNIYFAKAFDNNVLI